MAKAESSDTNTLQSLALQAGIPEVIVEWAIGAGERDQARLQRFVDSWRQDWRNADKLQRAWSSIERHANSDDALLTLFMVMPDGPKEQPFSLVFYRRRVDPGVERQRYADWLGHCREVKKIISRKRQSEVLTHLLSDCIATDGEAAEAASFFRQNLQAFESTLLSLEKMLELVDPTAKIPTKHWNSPHAAIRNYVILVAGLNRYLRVPQPAALAFLANANCPSVSISKDQLAKAWARGVDKRIR
ncbi:MAG: hypothetical protein ACOY5C_07990 [Pseudomonadota bacterium]